MAAHVGLLPGITLHKGLVKIIGLTPEKSAGHKTIWSALTEDRTSENVPLSYKMATLKDVFPPRKNLGVKTESNLLTDDTALAAGILKANWMTKHAEEIPSVVVVFAELEWNARDWETRQQEFSTLIRTLRASLAGRPTKIVAVLLQEEKKVEGEESLVETRAVSLRQACGLTTKSSLFVLQSKDPALRGIVLRLEQAFYDLSRVYYSDEITRVRAKLDMVNLQNAYVLSVRYQFKLGFYYELRQDKKDALREYQGAYATLKKIDALSSDIHEVKSVAGIIAIKTCRLLFITQAPLDALARFRDHINFYKSKVGKEQLSFQHAWWLSHQHSMFGQLFEDAVNNGLGAILTEHPGFYWRQAAKHACTRKALAAKYARDVNARVTTKPPVFYGQEVYSVVEGVENIKDISVADTKLLLASLHERNFPHSEVIILLYENARTHFKKYSTIKVPAHKGAQKFVEQSLPRMYNYIGVEMSSEYIATNEHGKALELLLPAIDVYRSEEWSPLLTATLLSALRCAYRLGMMELYVALALELSGSNVTRTLEQRTLAQSNLVNILMKQDPHPEPGDKVSAAWKAVAAAEAEKTSHVPFAVDATNLKHCITCKVLFEKATTTTTSHVTMTVALKSTLPLPLTFNELRPVFTLDEYNTVPIVYEGSDPAEEFQDVLVPNAVRIYRLTFPTVKKSEHEIKCQSVSILVGNKGWPATLTWRVDTAGVVCTHGKEGEDLVLPASPAWGAIPVRTSIRVLPRTCLLNTAITHQSPALVNESYRIGIRMENKEEEEMTDVVVRLHLREVGDDKDCKNGMLLADDAPHSHGHTHGHTPLLVLRVPQISKGGDAEVFARALFARTCVSELEVVVEYTRGSNVDDPAIGGRQIKKELVRLEACVPFQSEFSFQSQFLEELTPDAVRADEPFVMFARTKSVLPWPVVVSAVELRADPSATTPYPFLASSDGCSQDVQLGPGEEMTSVFPLRIPGDGPSSLNLGTMCVTYHRVGASEPLSVVCALPEVKIATPDVSSLVQAPPLGHTGKLVPYKCMVTNNTTLVQEVEIFIESTSSFMFSGAQRIRMRIPPKMEDDDSNHVTLRYNLFPLLTGEVALPLISVTDMRQAVVVPTEGPKNIFVKP